MRPFKKFILCLSLALLGASAQADLQKLLDMPRRPTMADLDRELPDTGRNTNPVQRSFQLNGAQRVLLEDAARLIATLERYFPGAIYLPLGRDVVQIGDAMDAFYRAHGEPGRIIRLDLSSASVPQDPDDPRFAQFWRTILDLENIADSPGYVLFDRTSYSAHSQSTRLVRSLYNEYERRFGPRSDLLTKFNVATVDYGYKRLPSKRGFFTKQLEKLAEHGIPYPILKMNWPINRMYSTYSTEWHGSFRALQSKKDGTARAALPRRTATNLQDAREIVKLLWQIRREAASPDFLKAVQAEAKNRGYTFKLRGCERAAL